MKIASNRITLTLILLPFVAVAQVAIDDNDIGGVVTSENGPEAGVWVIAETDEFDTFFAKIVVTDDEGRYVVPDLPNASFEVWVRGYGLVDSAKVVANPGANLDLTAIVAPSELEAAQVYPAAAWYAMMHLPDESDLGHIPGGLNEYLGIIKNQSCVGCLFPARPRTRSWMKPSFSMTDGESTKG